MKLAVTCSLVALAAIASIAGYVHASFSAVTAEDQVIEIRKGESVIGVANQLRAEGLIAIAPLWIRLVVALTAGEGPLLAGEYKVAAGSSGYDILAMLRSGKVLLRSVTFPEGWTVAQWRSRLASLPHIEHQTEHMTDGEIAAMLGSAGGLEGWLFPDTYHYPKGASDADILRMAHQAMGTQLDAAWRGRDRSLNLASPREALILASIVEKETGHGPDRGKIASVFHNRLKSGMRLQSDPTVIYGLGSAFDGDLTRAHLQRDTPYNSYTRSGLPPGPICSPGLAAIRATLAPDASNYLYFVAVGDGKSFFSRTLEEHNDAVNRYQRKAGKRQAKSQAKGQAAAGP